MRKIFFAIVLKELISFMRSAALVAVVVYSFTIDIYIAGEGIDIEPRNVAVGYVDNSGGGMSKKILANLHTPEFVTPMRFNSQRELSLAIYNKEIMVGLVFESDFEKLYREKKDTQVNVLLDATSASQGFTTLIYLQNILFQFENIQFPVELKIHKLFNQNSDNRSFMALSELLSLITMLVVILTAIVFVKEKEDGTWDIMLLMPFDAKLTILAKTLSQVIIVMAGVILSLGFVIFAIFDTPMNGSFWSFIFLTFLYTFSSAGIGLFVAAIAKDVMQVAQYSIIIMIPLIFLSGAWTPIYTMNPFLKTLAFFSPLRYYIEGSESIFYRGTPFLELYPYFLGVLFLGAILYLIGFRKIGRLF